jgi:hypothetical protein
MRNDYELGNFAEAIQHQKRRNEKSTMTSELDSLCGDPAAKGRNEKYTMNDDELDNFAKVIQ